MPLIAGTRLGPYEIVGAIGVGGMGEVYRARDTRLQREVAIKVLPDVVAADPDRLARFEREAQLLAAFNHPHIAQIHGVVEETGGAVPRSAIVMELVEGITLAERIAQGPVPIEEALPIARQIADAMDAAHERGIIHRDLKPANIKLTPSGSVKVLDFGLAKAVDPPLPSARDVANSPTFTSPATEIGLVLGTAAYMSPEQAKGRPVDKRADIWAFGCVLYEMLSGRRTFGGEDTSDIMAAILRSEVDWSALPAGTPSTVRRLLARCLDRDPQRRLRDIGDARIELEAAEHEPAPAVGAAVRKSGRSMAGTAILVALTGLVAATAVWWFKPAPPLPLRKLDVLTDVAAGSIGQAKISPDGSRIVYVAGNRLWVRELAQTKARDLGAVPEVTRLAWSPDGATIGYAALDGKVRTTPAAGGAAVVVCDIPESRRAIGLAWAGDDLMFAAWRGSLYSVNARGGTPKVLLALDPQKEVDFHALAATPDGKLVFVTHRQGNEYSMEMLDGGTRSALLPPMSISHVAYSGGHLLYVRDESNVGLWAVPLSTPPLNPDRAFLVDANARSVDAAGGGALLVGMAGSSSSFELVVADRAGKVARTIGTPVPVIDDPVLAPDGRRLLVLRGSQAERTELWMHDLAGGTGTRLTFGEAGYGYPAWFPSGDRVLFTEHIETVGGARLATLSTDGSGRRVELAKALRGAVSPDGRYLVHLLDDRGAGHLRYSTLGSDGSVGAAQPVFSTTPEPDVSGFTLSPDGRLLAYVERTPDDLTELFVRRFPAGEGRWQPSMANARIPRGGLGYGRQLLRWVRSTGELIFTVGTDRPERLRLMSVVVTDGPTLRFGAPTTLFEVDADLLGLGFDVTPDGRSIVMVRRVADQAQAPPLRFVLVQPWLAEFSR